MKPIILLLFFYCITIAPLTLSAQFSNGIFPLLSNEADFSYLSYRAYPLNSSNQYAGFMPVTLASRPVMVRMPVDAGDDDSKIYRITESGAYEYSYKDDDLIPKSKRGFKPVTVRTFFLETVREGLISSGISYKDFIRMPVEEKQALLDAREYNPQQEEHYEYAEANLIYRTSPDGYQIIVANDEIQLELSYGKTSDEEGRMIGVKYLPYFRPAPQLVKLLIDPWNNYQLSGHAYYKNINSVFGDLSMKVAQY